MSTPTCPFLSDAGRRVACEGSTCAIWAPELAEADDGQIISDMVPTGRGCCGLNHSREPWPDPAGGLDR